MNAIAVDSVATADVIQIIFRIENLHLESEHTQFPPFWDGEFFQVLSEYH